MALRGSMVVVLNVDGSSFENPRIFSFGGVLRRNDDNWLYRFARNAGVSTNHTCRVVSCVSWLDTDM